MRYPLHTLIFTEDSGLAGAVCYLTPNIQLTELHVRLIVEARTLMIEGTLNEEPLDWWEPGKYW